MNQIFFNMKKFMLTLGVMALAATVCTAASKETREGMVRLRENLIAALTEDYAGNEALHEEFYRLSDNGYANDAVMNQLYLQTTLTEQDYVNIEMNFRPSAARWPDIDYTDINRGCWQAALHLTRLCAMAKAYATPGHPLYKAKRMDIIFKKALRWWAKYDPANPNWWWTEIGIPRRVGILLTLVPEKMEPEVKETYLAILSRSVIDTKRLTGQNLVWEAGNLIMKAVAENDSEAVAELKEIIESQVKFSDAEGLQDDWSFHLHGHMLQFGNYGLAFFDSIAFWMRVMEGTPWEFSPESKKVLAGFADNGLGWCFWNGYMDPSMRGRHLFPGSGRGKDIAFGIARNNLSKAGVRTNGRFRQGKNIGGDRGGRYFPKSDCGIYRARKWYGSIRMQSERTLGFEMTNGENTNGFYSADGALLVMSKGDEYDDIFPCWDWRKLPGTTVRELDEPTPRIDPRYSKNDTPHVGGLACGKVLASTMELDRDSLYAVKSAFFFKDLIVNLGAGIRSSGNGGATTSIEQNFLTDRFMSRSRTAVNGDTGYLMADGNSFQVSTASQSGSWIAMDPALADTVVMKDIFKIWIKHDGEKIRSSEGDTYAYMVFPVNGASRALRAEKKSPCTILSNTEACQAVRYRGTTVAVFHEAGSINGISAESPCIVIKKLFSEKRTPLPEKKHRQ